jgi:5-methylcytosine-specific restriction endonuclease McrA
VSPACAANAPGDVVLTFSRKARTMTSVPESAAQTKACIDCREVKPVAEFYVKRPGQYLQRCKPCHSAYTTARYHAKRAALGPPRPKATEAEKKARKAAYCKANAEKRRLAKAAWRRANVEQARAADAAYRAVRPEVYRRAARKWQQANPDAYQIIRSRADHKRRSRLADAGPGITLAEWKAIKAAQGFRCLLCGMVEPLVKLTVDHVVPVSKGGRHEASNIQALCGPCNSHKRARVMDLRPAPARRTAR